MDDNDYRRFGARVRFCRVYRAMKALKSPPSQTEFGKAVAKRMSRPTPFSEGTVSNWESDRYEPDRLTIAAIADEAEVSKTWLAFYEGQPTTEL